MLKTHEKLIFLESMAALSMPATTDPGVEAHHEWLPSEPGVNAPITAAGPSDSGNGHRPHAGDRGRSLTLIRGCAAGLSVKTRVTSRLDTSLIVAPIRMITAFIELGIAARVEDVCANDIAERRADQ